MDMLTRVRKLIQEQGYRTQNASIAIQAEKPRLAKYIDLMKARISATLGIDSNAVGITAGTNEGLGYVGEGKGITVHAYALIENK
jgi:2-C-methyl-D-erythritol 2,4-cyclodiphosphate synthase